MKAYLHASSMDLNVEPSFTLSVAVVSIVVTSATFSVIAFVME
jgi:hypothetical protein